MRPLIFLACLILGLLASAENEKLPELKLKNGKTFTTVIVTKKTADGIAIMHESGTARIPFEQLPDDLVKTLGGFDPEKAAEARKASAQSEEAQRAGIDRGIAAQSKAVKAKARPDVDAEIAEIFSYRVPTARERWEQTDSAKRYSIEPADNSFVAITYRDFDELKKEAIDEGARIGYTG